MTLPALIPELAVSDIQKTLHFYVRVLGFSVNYQRAEEGFAMLSIGEARLMVDQIDLGRTWRTASFELPLGRGINLEIEVNNLDQLLASLRGHQIKLFMEPEIKHYRVNQSTVKQRQFLVQDPDGYLLRFVEPVPQS